MEQRRVPEQRFILPLLGARLKTLREMRGLTLREVEQLTDKAIHYSQLAKVERGEVEIGALKLSRLCAFFDVTPDMVLGFKDGEA